MQDDHRTKATVCAVMAVWRGDEPAQISAAIDSILNQTRAADEFIIVQDGPVSNDIAAVLDAYREHPSVQISVLPTNQGRGPARNHAVMQSTGDVIAMMDADDISRPDRIEKQLRYFCEHNLDVLGGGIEEFDLVAGDRGETRKVPLSGDDIRRVVKFRSAFNHVTLMYARSFFDQIGGYSNLNFVEDWDFYLRADHAGASMANMVDVLVDVRRAMWRRRSVKYLREEIKVLGMARSRGQIGIGTFISGVLIRTGKFLAPQFLLKLAYRFALRQKS